MTEVDLFLKACLDKVCADNPDHKQKDLIYRKLGIKLPPKQKCPHIFLTVQIDEKKLDDREKEKIADLASLLNNYKWYKDNDYIYIFEYFSTEYPEGGNLHIHYLIKGNKFNKTSILRDCNSKFKHCSKAVNYQASTSQEHYDNRLNYLKGDKKSHLKNEFQQKDCVWRTDNKIEPYYTNAIS